MTPKKILCDIITKQDGERITHIDQIKKSQLSGRELFTICEQFSITTMQYFYKRDLRVTKLLYFFIGAIAALLLNFIF